MTPPTTNPQCGCRECNKDSFAIQFFACSKCGNKRCPHATGHIHDCTNSNEPGQLGSVFGTPSDTPVKAPEKVQPMLGKPTTNPIREPITHELKTDPAVFDAVKAGLKGFEIRKNDREFQVGDTLTLKRTEFTGQQMALGKPLIYTGEEETRTVTYILHGPIYGLEKGWCIMGITRGQLETELQQANALIDSYETGDKMLLEMVPGYSTIAEGITHLQSELAQMRQERKALREALRVETVAHTELHEWTVGKLHPKMFEGGAPTQLVKSLNSLQDARQALAQSHSEPMVPWRIVEEFLLVIEQNGDRAMPFLRQLQSQAPKTEAKE